MALDFQTRIRSGVAMLCIAAAFVFTAYEATASGDPLIEGAKQCTRYLPRQEREYGIPVHLMAAIASTESGRYHDRLKMKLPWPWTINAKGRGYFFETREEAIEATRKLISMGIRSIDVGCMQVNLEHHPSAFTSLEDAFEPSSNVAYAAKFLRTNYDIDGSWKKAAASYHSRTPERGKAYVQRVFGAWNNIINRVAQARGYSPEQAVEMASNYTGEYGAATFDKVQDIAPADAPKKKQSAAAEGSFKAPRMKVIQVREAVSKEKGVTVVRPRTAEEEDEAAASAPVIKQELTPLSSERGEVKPEAEEKNVATSPQPINGEEQDEAEGAVASANQVEIQQVQVAAAPKPEASPKNRAKFIRLSGDLRRHPQAPARTGGPRFIFDN